MRALRDGNVRSIVRYAAEFSFFSLFFFFFFFLFFFFFFLPCPTTVGLVREQASTRPSSSPPTSARGCRCSRRRRFRPTGSSSLSPPLPPLPPLLPLSRLKGSQPSAARHCPLLERAVPFRACSPWTFTTTSASLLLNPSAIRRALTESGRRGEGMRQATLWLRLQRRRSRLARRHGARVQRFYRGSTFRTSVSPGLHALRDVIEERSPLGRFPSSFPLLFFFFLIVEQVNAVAAEASPPFFLFFFFARLGEVVVLEPRQPGHGAPQLPLGDLARLTAPSCPCGRTSPPHGPRGRVAELLYLADGRVRPPGLGSGACSRESRASSMFSSSSRSPTASSSGSSPQTRRASSRA